VQKLQLPLIRAIVNPALDGDGFAVVLAYIFDALSGNTYCVTAA
jgi:hypothetical protein